MYEVEPLTISVFDLMKETRETDTSISMEIQGVGCKHYLFQRLVEEPNQRWSVEFIYAWGADSGTPEGLRKSARTPRECRRWREQPVEGDFTTAWKAWHEATHAVLETASDEFLSEVQ